MRMHERGATDVSRGTSVREVERAILSRIASGQYGVNARLPACERLGRELGANKNTVSKAYQALARRGYTVSRPGRGTFVLRRPRDSDRLDAMNEIRSLLAYAAEQADVAGLSRADLQSLAADAIDRYFDRVRVRVGYVDCNRADASELGRELQVASATPVDPLILDDVLHDTARIVSRYDVLGVAIAHLHAVEHALRAVGSKDVPETIPIVAQPDPASLAKIARLKAGTRLLVVSDMPDMLAAQASMARSLNPRIEVSETLYRSPRRRDLQRGADVILGNRRFSAQQPELPVIEVAYQLDERSAALLAERVSALKRGPASADVAGSVA
jgi:GntR family transcriptional regulator